MVAALALIVFLVLFTALDFPFRGGATIGPDAMEQVLGKFENSKLSDL
jgi:hypothetical protein